MTKGLKKGLKIAGLSLGGLVALLLLAVVVIIACEPFFYGDFYARAEQEFMLPGISDGFVQQGITHADGVFLSCGYMTDEKLPSRIYVTEDGESRYVTLKNEAGDAYGGHAGGLSAYGELIYLCDSEKKQMLVYSTDDVTGSAAGGSVTAIGAFAVHSNASFCYVEDDILYVGEFYREQNYKTPSSHHLTAPSGDKHHSLIFGYPLDAGAPLGLKSSFPLLAYSVCDLAQGMCVTASGRIVISTSYALANSHNYVYRQPAAEREGEYELEGRKVPLWYLDSDKLDKDYVLPPMSEELVCVDGRVYVIGESASNKYIFGKLLRSKFVWSYPVD